VRAQLGISVLEASLSRLGQVYSEGHRVMVSFSAGKDSNVVLELAIMAAEQAGRLPVEAIMRDEEILFPGSFEYAERVAARPEVEFHWVVANQPIINCFNRAEPYWWVFDPQLPPEAWVRQPPDYAEYIDDINIQRIVSPERYPPPEGRDLIDVLGLRVIESRGRMWGLYSSGGFMTKARENGVRVCRPIYDWQDGDVWNAINRFKWDYNSAYDTMHRLGIRRQKLRIAPPTMNAASVELLKLAAHAWPQWFDKVCERCPGTRTAAMYGKRAISPERRRGETWQECFQRCCIDEAPEWIRERAEVVQKKLLGQHASHATTPFPDVKPCPVCPQGASYSDMVRFMYGGEPFSVKYGFLPYVEPELFRPGAGRWGGTPTF
jgi:predicted phosphoadenosine phosphosulfate sulfurtransferase